MHRRQRRATNLNLPGKVKTGAPGGGVAVRQPLCTSFLFKRRSPPTEIFINQQEIFLSFLSPVYLYTQ